MTVGSPRPPGEGGKSAEVRLTQIAPGCYAGSQAAGQGTYWLSGQVRRNGELIDSVRSGTVVLYMPEVAAKAGWHSSGGREERFADDAPLALAARRRVNRASG